MWCDTHQCTLHMLTSIEECLKLEKWFKSMKEAMVKMSCWILSVEVFLKQENVDWRILLVLAWTDDKSSERLCPTLDIDQRKDQGQLHRLHLPCFVEHCYFTCLLGVLPVPSLSCRSTIGDQPGSVTAIMENHTEWLGLEGMSRKVQPSCSSRAT